jgi:enterochelin esterase-like enzyme
MKREIDVRVVLPPGYDENPDMKYPVLYTLHGRGASFASFSEMAPLIKELADKPMIVTCFDGGNMSFYLDAVNGGRVPKEVVSKKPRETRRLSGEALEKARVAWDVLPEELLSLYTTFFFDEFVPAMDGFYRVDTKKRAVTGFSMGGFGAVHYMLERPEFFVSISGLSSVFYFEERFKDATSTNSFESLLGSYEENKDLYRIILHSDRIKAARANGIKLPPIFQHCGSEDRLIAGNEKMHKILEEAGYDIVFKATPGKHNWPFWRDASVGVIDFHWKHFNVSN